MSQKGHGNFNTFHIKNYQQLNNVPVLRAHFQPDRYGLKVKVVLKLRDVLIFEDTGFASLMGSLEIQEMPKMGKRRVLK